MNSQLRQIDEKGEILLNDLKHGRISQAQYDSKASKLRDRAFEILTKAGWFAR